jgi:hypothetical protein
VGWYRFHRKRTGTRYAILVFLHLVASAGHVVHSGASGERNVYALFFLLESDRYIFYKKCSETRYTKIAFSHPVGSVGHVVHFDASGM